MHILLSPAADAPLPEVAEHQPVEFVCPASPGERLALAVDGRALEPFLRPDDPAWRWRWNPGAAVGIYELRLEVATSGGEPLRYTWRLRVAPAKIDQERYALLLDDIERLAAGLSFALGGAGAEGASPSPAPERRPAPAEQYYALFQQQLDAFERAARRILARPREQLRRLVADAPLGGPDAPGADALARAARGDLQPAPPGLADELQQAIRPGGGLLPATLPGARGAPTADFYEHRLLKRLIELLTSRAARIGALAERTAARLARAAPDSARAAHVRGIAQGCADARRRLRELRAAPLLAEVGALPAFRGPTPLIQRDPAYRQVYRTWLALHRAPLVTLHSPLFDIPIADLPRLYESWCTLQVAGALLALGDVEEQRIVATAPPPESPADDLDHTVALVEGQPLLRIRRGETTLTLRYQPRYRPAQAGARHAAPLPAPGDLISLDRHTRVPDLAVEIERQGAPPQVLVLDAKYRLEAEGGVPQDALAEAYAYLGAIGTAGARATIGAAILFPGRGTPEIYPSGVGGVPLLPGAASDLPAVLAAWIDLHGE